MPGELERRRAELQAQRDAEWANRKPMAEDWLGDQPWEIVLGRNRELTIDCREVARMEHRARTKGRTLSAVFAQHAERPDVEGLALTMRDGNLITLRRDHAEGIRPRELMAEIHRRGRLGLGLGLDATALPAPEGDAS